jgi:hypothetical protein
MRLPLLSKFVFVVVLLVLGVGITSHLAAGNGIVSDEVAAKVCGGCFPVGPGGVPCSCGPDYPLCCQSVLSWQLSQGGGLAEYKNESCGGECQYQDPKDCNQG